MDEVSRIPKHVLLGGWACLWVVALGSMVRGIAPRRACAVAIAQAIGDDPDLQQVVNNIVDVLMP